MHSDPHAAPRPRKSIDDQLVPLINIVFLLLIFFMVAGQITQRDQRVEPPQSLSRKPAPETPALLVLGRDGMLRINGRAIAAPDLMPALATYADDTDITLAADREVLAADLAPILSALGGAGFDTVTLYARQREQP